MIKDLDQFTNLVLAKPCLLEKPKCANLKHFLHIIYHDKPLKYPMLSFTEAAKVTEMNKTTAITLTPGVSKALYERTTVPFNPVVQVTCKDRTVKEVHDPDPSNISQTLKMPSYTLSASDGDKKVFTIKLATQLGISAALIDSCSVIRLTKFLPLYYNYEDMDDARVLLLLLDFEVVGLMPLVDYSLTAPPEICRPVALSIDTVPDRQPVASPNSNNNSVPPSANDQGRNGSLDSASDVTCTGNQCSSKYFHFSRCITELIPPQGLSLKEIMKTCPFASTAQLPSSLPTTKKRFLLFWWYATNVFGVHGKGNCMKLPNCLEKTIRELYPSETGQYTGFREAPIHDD
jgi:hypothetical protein